MRMRIFTVFALFFAHSLSQAQLTHNMSFENHCPALPIARFNEVPYQVVDANFRVGVVAFHKEGINRVKFTATDGIHTVNNTVYQFALNTRTNTKEYSMVLNPSLFDDKLVTITAVVYANTGETRTLDFALYANAGKTIKDDTVYVSVNGSDLNNGLSGNPVKTIERALDIIRTNKKFPVTILITAHGSYELPDINVGYKAITNDLYVTVKSKSSLNPSKVIMKRTELSAARMATKLVKWEGVTFDFGKIAQYYAFGNKAVWFNNVRWINSYGWNDPCYADTNCKTLAPIRGTSYATNSSSRNMLYGFINQELVRNCEVVGCIGDVFQNSNMIVNCRADSIDGTVLEHHTDLYQAWGERDNLIVYGLTATNLVDVQTIFLEPTTHSKPGNPRYKLSNSAFVDIDAQHIYADSTRAANGGPPNSQMISWFEHVLFKNLKLPHQVFLMRTDNVNNQWWSASGVVFEKCQFHPRTYNDIVNGNPIKGVKFIDSYSTFPDCNDNIKNGDETGIDCGTCCLVDKDGDDYFIGYCDVNNGLYDCDDNNPLVHPGAPEILDGIDNNCDGNQHSNYSKDFDADGIINGKDNCIFSANPIQEDYDKDHKGDVCDMYFTRVEKVEERETGYDDLNTVKHKDGLSWELVIDTAEVRWDEILREKYIRAPLKGSGNSVMLVTHQGRNSWSNLNVDMSIAANSDGPNRGFVVLFKDANNFYFFHLSEGQMKKRMNGNDIILGSDASLKKGESGETFMNYSIRVEFKGTGVDFYVRKNGSPEIAFHDSQPYVQTGSVGFISETNPSNNKNFGIYINRLTIDEPVTGFPIDYDADIVLCSGTTVTLSAPEGYSQYAWSTGASTQSILVSSPGSYYVSVQDASTCGGSDTVAVAYYNTVSLGRDKLFCPGDAVVLDGGHGFTSYLWTTGATTQTIAVYSPGIYSVEVMNGDGCTSYDEIAVKKTFKCITIGDVEVKASPNINDGAFELSVDIFGKSENTGYYSSNNNTADVKIISIDGRVVFNTVVEGIGPNGFKQNINLNSLTTGMYFILVRINEEIFTEKVFISSNIN